VQGRDLLHFFPEEAIEDEIGEVVVIHGAGPTPMRRRA
jgi:hypothetical protein